MWLGIVTRFDLATYPLMKVQYTANLYDAADLHNIVKATVQVQDAMETDPKIGLFTNFRKPFIAVGMLYADWSDDTPKAFSPFLDLDSLVNVMIPRTNGTMLSLVQLLGQFHPPEPGRSV